MVLRRRPLLVHSKSKKITCIRQARKSERETEWERAKRRIEYVFFVNFIFIILCTKCKIIFLRHSIWICLKCVGYRASVSDRACSCMHIRINTFRSFGSPISLIRPIQSAPRIVIFCKILLKIDQSRARSHQTTNDSTLYLHEPSIYCFISLFSRSFIWWLVGLASTHYEINKIQLLYTFEFEKWNIVTKGNPKWPP